MPTTVPNEPNHPLLHFHSLRQCVLQHAFAACRRFLSWRRLLPSSCRAFSGGVKFREQFNEGLDRELCRLAYNRPPLIWSVCFLLQQERFRHYRLGFLSYGPIVANSELMQFWSYILVGAKPPRIPSSRDPPMAPPGSFGD